MSNAQLELTPILLDSLYTEAMLLADEARACFDRSFDAGHLSPEISVAFSCESLKVTTRLMHSIAWLLNQKALRAGEITESEAQSETNNLGYTPASDGPLVLQFPLDAQALIGASEELYDRLQRLSEKMRAPVPQASEPHAMRDRLRASF
jgi:regulator of CtrA degradation